MMDLQYTFNMNMAVSGVILIVTFIFIFMEGFHQIHRTKIALAGAVVMIIVGQIMGFYNQHQAVAAVDWNVMFLLGAMMTIVAILIPTGGFDWLSFVIANWSKGRLYLLLVALGTAVTVISLLLDNVTTVIIFGPLTLFICRALGVNPVPYLLAEALLSDTGGIATLVGDPPNIMIGSAAGIDFNSFLYHMGLPVLMSWLVCLLLLKFIFKSELAKKPKAANFGTKGVIKDMTTLRWSLTALFLLVILFTQHRGLHMEPGLVAMIGLSFVFIMARKIDIEHCLREVELPVLLFFLALFVIVGGVEHSHLLTWFGQYIVPYAKSKPVAAAVLLMWVGGFISAIIDNIPFTVAMIPIIQSMEAHGINIAPYWWSLALGVGLGGNGTHIGSTANVYIVTISERIAREIGDPSYRITPGVWFKKGMPVMLATLVAASFLMVTFFDFFGKITLK